MPTLLYGLTLPAEPLPSAVRGVAGEPVRALPCGSLAAIVGTVEAKPAPTLATIQVHDEALRQCVEAGATVAAVRFGQLFEDDATCARDVRTRAARIAALLEEHRGCVEMRALATVPVPDATTPAASGPGQAYLESLRPIRPPEGLTLAPALGPLIRSERVELAAARGKGMRGVAYIHLVHRTNLDAYRDAITRAAPDARLVGPLALHAFAEPVA